MRRLMMLLGVIALANCGGSRSDDSGEGIVVDTTDGSTLYIADTDKQRIQRVVFSGGVVTSVTTVAGTGIAGSSGGDGGLPTAAQLNYPVAVALDDELLYIADLHNGRILKVDFFIP